MHIIHLRKPIVLFSSRSGIRGLGGSWYLGPRFSFLSCWSLLSGADGNVGTNYPDFFFSSLSLSLRARWLHLITVTAGEKRRASYSIKLVIKMYRSRLCALVLLIYIKYNCTTGGWWMRRLYTSRAAQTRQLSSLSYFQSYSPSSPSSRNKIN